MGRKRIAWGLRAVALAALLAYLAGRHASRSGGLVVVEVWLDRPLVLVGAAVVLIVVSLIIELDFRTRWSQIGCAVGLVALVFGGLPIAVMTYVFGGYGGRVDRFVSPNHEDRVLTVTNVAFSIDPIYRVELEVGDGWSTRHWSMGVWDTRGGDFVRIDWSGPEQITITGQKKLTVFDVGPDGSLGDPRELPLAPPLP
ncbi:hypothetical protein [Kitasatospora sp. SUK 42]|uniref:hypothetical protein n=1 Tax=Kitasatospora sp. SUK 42 TaxID=1588882 RepID=UPI0018C997B8|nr:hypothetical protein [Kitasatospora sp. SUK 42]MBV2154123.1 hypothetical protein [Kitasatospora sp. SUK 42]